MNSKPKTRTTINPRGHPPEFEPVIREKSANFVGREFVFAAINDFFERENRGYFTLVGTPGSGKSAILAKYVTEHPHVVYYNAQIAGKNQVDQFLTTLCNQLINDYPLGYTFLPDNVTDGSWFLSLLLQKIGDQLEPKQRLIITIDALDAIERRSQTPGSNLFYLPRYLPNRVYFILARRPFLREKSGLLIETPSQVFDLDAFPKQNREDVQKYIDNNFDFQEQQLLKNIADLCENNFMYLKCVGDAILLRNAGAIAPPTPPYSPPLNQLPETLEAYYQQHWQKMKGEDLSAVELGVLQTLIALPSLKKEAISAQLIAETIDEDECEVEEILENWLEFLVKKQIDGELCYTIYHSSFRDWLSQQVNL